MDMTIRQRLVAPMLLQMMRRLGGWFGRYPREERQPVLRRMAKRMRRRKASR